jgi:hypothetical protein
MQSLDYFFFPLDSVTIVDGGRAAFVVPLRMLQGDYYQALAEYVR